MTQTWNNPGGAPARGASGISPGCQRTAGGGGGAAGSHREIMPIDMDLSGDKIKHLVF